MIELIDQQNSVRRGIMFVIEAPSGTGKTTVIKKLMERHDNLKFSVSVTTRAPREGEVDGVDYHYVSDEEYNKLLAEDAFYECVNSQYGCRYGTLRSEVDSFLNVGQDVIFDMDWEGLRQLKEKAPNDVVSVYMLPPSIKVLRERLEGRHTDSKETIEKRMGMLVDKMSHWTEYDYVIICVNPEQACSALEKILSAERLKRVRQLGLKEFTDNLIKEAKQK
ncbi:MAG: guanylate kinase [Alphaproteobacteria bacterium]|nr:guanylate kinase [Alphaproteobacteria bacterium]